MGMISFGRDDIFQPKVKRIRNEGRKREGNQSGCRIKSSEFSWSQDSRDIPLRSVSGLKLEY